MLQRRQTKSKSQIFVNLARFMDFVYEMVLYRQIMITDGKLVRGPTGLGK